MPDAFDRARTPLLTLITQESLDTDYQMVAARVGRRRHGVLSRSSVVTALAVFGVLVTVAAVQTERNADVTDASRATLIERIESRRAALRDDQARIAELRDDNAAAEDDLTRQADVLNATEADVRDLQALTGFVAVSGEGIRVVLDNAPFADETELLRDSDLALLADALWSAGAEAIAVNGQRLTARSAIRNSGPAIEVNGVGIAPPYTVLAIGDSGTLPARFQESGSGLAFAGLAAQYGFTYDIDAETELRVPAAPPALRRIRSAQDSTRQDSTGRDRPEGDGT
jgi:uncharacterized protein YlxW (UPF0749 family)